MGRTSGGTARRGGRRRGSDALLVFLPNPRPRRAQHHRPAQHRQPHHVSHHNFPPFSRNSPLTNATYVGSPLASKTCRNSSRSVAVIGTTSRQTGRCSGASFFRPGRVIIIMFACSSVVSPWLALQGYSVQNSQHEHIPESTAPSSPANSASFARCSFRHAGNPPFATSWACSRCAFKSAQN